MITLWKVTLIISTFFWTSAGIERKDTQEKYTFLNQKTCEEFISERKEIAANIRNSDSFDWKEPRVYVEGICLPSAENFKIKPGYVI